MVNEVNKLIFNTLLDEGAVYIPEIGTIRIVSSQGITQQHLTSPYTGCL